MASIMSQNQFAQLEQLLNSAVQTSTMLLSALQKEYASLGLEPPEDFLSALQDKQEALDKLGKIDAALLRMEAHGFHPGKDSQRFFISHYGQLNGDRIEHIWQEFLELLEQCHHQNSINGCMIKQQQQATQQALAILRGQDTEAVANYGPTGISTTGGIVPNPLAKA